MFKVIDNKIYYRDEVVGVLDSTKRASLLEDVTRELEGHTSLIDVQGLIDKKARLETEIFKADPTHFATARW